MGLGCESDTTEKLKAGEGERCYRFGEALGFVILWCGGTGGDSSRTAKSGAGMEEQEWGGRKAALAYSWRLPSLDPCSKGYSKTGPQPSSRLQPQLLKMKEDDAGLVQSPLPAVHQPRLCTPCRHSYDAQQVLGEHLPRMR